MHLLSLSMILTVASAGERITEELSITPSLREKVWGDSTMESARMLMGTDAVNVPFGEKSTASTRTS